MRVFDLILTKFRQLSLINKFCLINTIALALLLSWLIPFTRYLWDIIDNNLFFLLNGSLSLNFYWRFFWAIANNRLFDLVPAFAILLLFLWWAYRDLRYVQREQFTTLIVFLVFMGILRWLFGNITDLLQYHRPSPSLVFPESAFMLSLHFPWLNPKDTTFWSFPGDHGYVLLCFMFFFYGYGAGGFRKVAVISLLFFNLPRMVSGAHWITDVAVGSMVLALFTVSFWFFTPLKYFCIPWCTRKLNPVFDVLFRILPERTNSKGGG